MNDFKYNEDKHGIFVSNQDLLDNCSLRFMTLFFEELYKSHKNSSNNWEDFNEYLTYGSILDRQYWGVYKESVDGLSMDMGIFYIVSFTDFVNQFPQEYAAAAAKYINEHKINNIQGDIMIQGDIVQKNVKKYVKPSERTKTKPRQKPPVRQKTDVIIHYASGAKYTLKNIEHVYGSSDCEQPFISFEHATKNVVKKHVVQETVTTVVTKDVDFVDIKTPKGVITVYYNVNDQIFSVLDERVGSYCSTRNFGFESF